MAWLLDYRVPGKLKNSLHVHYPRKTSCVELILYVTLPDPWMEDLWCDFLFIQVLKNKLKGDSLSWSKDSRSNLS
jgi:hypothetical protein